MGHGCERLKMLRSCWILPQVLHVMPLPPPLPHNTQGAILTKVKTILALDRDDPTKDDQVQRWGSAIATHTTRTCR